MSDGSRPGMDRRRDILEPSSGSAELVPMTRMSDGKRHPCRRRRPMAEPRRLLSSDICHLTSGLVGLGRFERPTSRLSGVRSDQLSYRPPQAPGPSPAPSRAAPPRRTHRSKVPSVFWHLTSVPRVKPEGRRSSKRKGCVDGDRAALQMSRQLPHAERLRVLTSDL